MQSLVSKAYRLKDINQREPTMKQFKDQTEEERDHSRIDKFLKRKAAAEAKGKTYKPRSTGNIERLIKEYPERFKGVIQEQPEPITSKEVEELREQLAIQAISLDHQTRLAAKQGETIRGLVKEGNHHKGVINQHGSRLISHSQAITSETREFIKEQTKTIDKQASQIRYFQKIVDSTGKGDLEKELIQLRRDNIKLREDKLKESNRTTKEIGSLRARVNYYTKQEKLNSK